MSDAAKIATRCPACGGQTLFVGSGGHLTCSLTHCPQPCFEKALSTRLANGNDAEPIPMLLWCPECGERHIDEGAFATKEHHTHACQSCGHVWRPAVRATVGVQFLPGFKNKAG